MATQVGLTASLTAEQAIAAAVLAGTAYFYAEEAQVPSGTNCSYLASPWTDAVATAGGAVCAYRGLKNNDPIVAGCGACVVTIHIWQYFHHKRHR